MASLARRRFGLRIPNTILRKSWSGQFGEKPCSHLDTICNVTPKSHVCDDCLALDDPWIEVRVCMTCGYTGCCEDSNNQHALRHHQETGHPIIRPVQRGMDWLWCYPDSALLDPRRLPD